MKTIRYILIISISFFLFACSSNHEEETLPWFDFGKATYEEPFVGLLRNRPEILVKSLKYPPFSWVASDTVAFRKEFDITFNDECIRSKSRAFVQFKDESYMPVEDVTVFVNKKQCPDGSFVICADSIRKKIALKFVISPLAGDTVFNGFVFIRGYELDKANNVNLQQENNIVAHWTAKQEIGWPLLLWAFWLIAALLILVLIGYILYLIGYLLYNLYKTFKSLRGSVDKSKAKKKKLRKEKQEKDLWDILYKYYPEMKEVMVNLNMQSPAYFKKEYFEIRRISKKDFKIRHKYDGMYTKIELEICGNEIRAKAGAVPGEGRYDSQLNEFLNYPLPNKKYIIDNCFIYETDELGRVVKAKGNMNNSVNTLHRRHQDRWKEYPTWVKAMNGTPYDDGGHIFACSLNGPAEKINIVPMNSKWQRPGGDWYEKFENVMRKNVAEGKSVTSEIELFYKGKNKRPYAVKVRTNPNEKFQELYNPLMN